MPPCESRWGALLAEDSERPPSRESRDAAVVRQNQHRRELYHYR